MNHKHRSNINWTLPAKAVRAAYSAIRAGRAMTQAEMEALLEQLDAADNPHTCPHGRPTMLHFSSFHMEREFGRR